MRNHLELTVPGVSSKNFTEGVAAIVTDEARHAGYVQKVANGVSPFPFPYDTPLGMNMIYTLVSPFIESCGGPAMGLTPKAFPALTLIETKTSPILVNDTVTVQLPRDWNADGKTPVGAWIGPVEPIFQDVKIDGDKVTAKVPASDIAGQSYFVLNSNKDTVSDDTVLAGPALVQVQSPYENGKM